MEHLPVHLPHEVKVEGPVQYRWMYPFERFLNHLKKKIGNKARVEGSICKAYLAEEISNFCSYYFQPHVDTKSRDLGRNVVDDDDLESTTPELFQFSKGRGKGVQTRFLDSKDVKHAHHYVLSNFGVLGGYERMFEVSMMQKYPGIFLHDIWSKFSHEFSRWFQDFVIESNETDEVIRALAMGPSRQAKKKDGILPTAAEVYESTHSVCVGNDEVELMGEKSQKVMREYMEKHEEYKNKLMELR